MNDDQPSDLMNRIVAEKVVTALRQIEEPVHIMLGDVDRPTMLLPLPLYKITSKKIRRENTMVTEAGDFEE